jgi:hypothetical protein
MREWSIEMYARFRGFIKQNNSRRISKKTPAGKLGGEYFELLKMGAKNQHAGCLKYIRRCDELREAQQQTKKINLIKE